MYKQLSIQVIWNFVEFRQRMTRHVSATDEPWETNLFVNEKTHRKPWSNHHWWVVFRPTRKMMEFE